jgi:hypothetical protein
MASASRGWFSGRSVAGNPADATGGLDVSNTIFSGSFRAE